MDLHWQQPLELQQEKPCWDPWAMVRAFANPRRQGKNNQLVFFIVQMTMAVGLHNEVLLAALQHFVLPALSPLLAISPSFPTELLRGLNQLSVVCQSVSVIPYNWEKLSTVFSFSSSMHISPISKSLWKTSYSIFDESSLLSCSSAGRKYKNNSRNFSEIKPAMTSSWASYAFLYSTLHSSSHNCCCHANISFIILL